jgi:hypothetical protein
LIEFHVNYFQVIGYKVLVVAQKLFN